MKLSEALRDVSKPDKTTAEIEGLDFEHEPKCVMFIANLLMKLTNGSLGHRNECTKKAVWLVLFPCGHDHYSCNRHKKHPTPLFNCGPCGSKPYPLDSLKWIPIK